LVCWVGVVGVVGKYGVLQPLELDDEVVDVSGVV